VLLSGIVSPLAALFSYALVYAVLTSLSADHEKDWLFRLSLSTVAITVPFLVTLALAIKDHRQHALSLSGKVGVTIAILSLGLAWKPVNDGIVRSRQSRNMSLKDVAAPHFATLDIQGTKQSLDDQKGKVVLVNIWATWCEPCRSEMPKLDRLYQERKQQGFIVFGLSDEDIDVQRKFVGQVSVSYPLLTLRGGSPPLLSRHYGLPGYFPDRPPGTTAACAKFGPAVREGGGSRRFAAKGRN
jgi:thiol-disulfide isomerase/thioredoxin